MRTAQVLAAIAGLDPMTLPSERERYDKAMARAKALILEASRACRYNTPSTKWVNTAGCSVAVTGITATKSPGVSTSTERVWHSKFKKRAYPGTSLAVTYTVDPFEVLRLARWGILTVCENGSTQPRLVLSATRRRNTPPGVGIYDALVVKQHGRLDRKAVDVVVAVIGEARAFGASQYAAVCNAEAWARALELSVRHKALAAWSDATREEFCHEST